MTVINNRGEFLSSHPRKHFCVLIHKGEIGTDCAEKKIKCNKSVPQKNRGSISKAQGEGNAYFLRGSGTGIGPKDGQSV